MNLSRLTLLLLFPVAPLGAQARDLKYEPELTIDLAKHGVGRFGTLVVDSRGRMVLATDTFQGELLAFDSAGNRVPGWGTSIGRRNRGDIGWVQKVGWVGGSMWIEDRAFDQIAILDDSGRVRQSMERPAWVRPAWKDRRAYPLFSAASWEAVYPDGSMLVAPLRPRALFDTPGYDRSAVYLLRVDKDGRILRTIARLPATATPTGATRLQLRDGTQRKNLAVPYGPRTLWRPSADGQRIVIVRPLMSASDSGAFQVTMLNAEGDTVFSRRHVTEASRVPAAEVERGLAAIQPFGRYTAEWIRDTLRKQIPVFESRIMNVVVGVDHSTWVWVRSPVAEARALVIGPGGELAGQTAFAPFVRLSALSVDRIWTIQRDRMRNAQGTAIVRMKRVTATASPPTRSARTSASSPPKRSP